MVHFFQLYQVFFSPKKLGSSTHLTQHTQVSRVETHRWTLSLAAHFVGRGLAYTLHGISAEEVKNHFAWSPAPCREWQVWTKQMWKLRQWEATQHCVFPGLKKTDCRALNFSKITSPEKSRKKPSFWIKNRQFKPWFYSRERMKKKK